MIIDSHCHLDYEPISNSVQEVLERAKKEGISKFLTISTEDRKFKKILEIVNSNKSVYGTYGIHPHESKNHININSKYILSNLQKNKKIIGVGETGLDFFYNHSEKKIQIDLFHEHINAAQESNLPIIVHTRNAEKDTLDILKRAVLAKNLKILIHCFTGTKEFAFKLLDIGAFISASGIITFKKSSLLAETFKEIPNNRILVETDSPYLSPEPLRGKSNEPSHLIHTVKFLAKIKHLDVNELSNMTTANFFKLFGELN